MLTITIKGGELVTRNREFITVKDTVLSLEHSLVSISKWESKWHKPFISKEDKTYEETIDYVRCMNMTQNVNTNIYMFLSNENLMEIKKYMDDPMTATWFNERNQPPGKRNSEQITSELVYYWMIALEIPKECEKWHFNRLMTLIRICNIKNQPAKKYGKKELMRNNAALNAARKKKLGTSG